MTDHEAAARGQRAFDELTELNGVFDRLEARIFEGIKATPVGPAHDALILKLHMQLHTLEGLKIALREMVDNGRMAEVAMAMAGLNRPN